MTTNEEQIPETKDPKKNRQGSSEPARLSETPDSDVSTKNRQGSSEPAN